jgi:predicted ABC-type ATPase
MFVVAGPSGSGKSRLFPVDRFGVDAFNVDDLAASLHGSHLGISPPLRAQASARCEGFVREHIAARVSFAVETTLRTTIALEQAAAAKTAGFRTVMVFLGTCDTALNIERVRVRGLMGGHAAPLSLLHVIFEASRVNLRRALDVFDHVRVYDNSGRGDVPTAPAARVDHGARAIAPDAPAWVREALTR